MTAQMRNNPENSILMLTIGTGTQDSQPEVKGNDHQKCLLVNVTDRPKLA